jgi:hypothetical protein
LVGFSVGATSVSTGFSVGVALGVLVGAGEAVGMIGGNDGAGGRLTAKAPIAPMTRTATTRTAMTMFRAV